MKPKSRREDVKLIIKQLKSRGMTFEMIGKELGVCISTVFYWGEGTRKPPMLAVKKLKSMVQEVVK